jgi:hypothetical protein
MFERIGRGWRIAKASWGVLKQHPSLLVFPVLSVLAFVLLFGLVGGVAYAGGGTQLVDEVSRSLNHVNTRDPMVYVVLYLLYFVASFITIFFNAALVSCALDAFAGRTPTVGSGFSAAIRRLPQILGWSAVSATVGLVLNIVQSVLRDKLGFLGSLLGSLLDIAWAVVTYFVVPVLVVDGVGPIEAVKRSSSILKRTWGESLAGEGGLGIVSFLLMLPVFLVGLPLGFLAADTSPALVVVVAAVAVLYIAVLSIVFAALNTIFRAGTYLYATTGQAPTAFDPALLQNAFHSK